MNAALLQSCTRLYTVNQRPTIGLRRKEWAIVEQKGGVSYEYYLQRGAGGWSSIAREKHNLVRNMGIYASFVTHDT